MGGNEARLLQNWIPIPTVGAVYDRAQSGRLHSSKSRAVIDRAYSGNSNSFTPPLTSLAGCLIPAGPGLSVPSTATPRFAKADLPKMN